MPGFSKHERSSGSLFNAHVIGARIGLRRSVTIVATSAVFALAAMAAASTSSAYTYTDSGRPGTVYTYKTLGSQNMGYAWIHSNSIRAYRSPGSTGTQKIKITWRVWRRNTNTATWELQSQLGATWSNVYSNQPYVDYGGFPPYEDAMKGYFITDLTITWWTSTGAFLGQTYRQYNQFGDYQCYQVWNGCSVVWIGGQYSLLLN
jgi:hypothetical protein